MPQDYERIKRNINKMIEQGAPEGDIDDYIAIEGVTAEQLRTYNPDKGIFERAGENLWPSAKKFVSDVAQPFINPAQTVQALQSMSEEILPWAGPKENAILPAVGEHYADRYGSLEQAKETFATDPVGFAADVSLPLAGGGSVLAKSPGMVGKVGRVVQKTGQALDPINMVTKPIGATSRLVKKGLDVAVPEVMGLTTGAGATPFKRAYRAGQEGGETAARFKAGMRSDLGTEPVERAAAAMRAKNVAKSKAYTEGMKGVRGSGAVVDFSKIDDAIKGVIDDYTITTSKGSYIKGGEALKSKLNEMNDLINQWRLDPELHTASNIDQLKQAIDELWVTDKAGVPVTRVRNAIKQEIVRQVPDYADVMADYEKSLRDIRAVEKELSLGKNANPATTLRKLQSATRDNVNTSFGERAKMISELDDNIMTDLSGQALSTWMPQGLQRTIGGGVSAGVVGSMIDPLTGGLTLMSQSPRLMGEAALAAGKLSNAAVPISKGARVGLDVGRMYRPLAAVEMEGLFGRGQ